MSSLAILLAALWASSTAEAPSSPLGWLEGCWVSMDGATEEHWAQADDQYLFGYNTVQRDGSIVFFEQLRIESGEEGAVFFAYPRGNGPVIFKEADRTGTSIRFENPGHDDPQVIAYQRDADSLTASVSLIDGSNERQWVYGSCPTKP